MTLLLVGFVAWLMLAVFVCSLGRAAKAGDRLELESVRGWADLCPVRDPASPADAGPVRRRDEAIHRELLDARRALRRAEARLARLESGRRADAA